MHVYNPVYPKRTSAYRAGQRQAIRKGMAKKTKQPGKTSARRKVAVYNGSKGPSLTSPNVETLFGLVRRNPWLGLHRFSNKRALKEAACSRSRQ